MLRSTPFSLSDSSLRVAPPVNAAGDNQSRSSLSRVPSFSIQEPPFRPDEIGQERPPHASRAGRQYSSNPTSTNSASTRSHTRVSSELCTSASSNLANRSRARWRIWRTPAAERGLPSCAASSSASSPDASRGAGPESGARHNNIDPSARRRQRVPPRREPRAHPASFRGTGGLILRCSRHCLPRDFRREAAAASGARACDGPR